MDNDMNKTDSYFRDRLGGFELSPPESSWEIISRKLAERKKKRIMILVFRIAAGMAILLSTGLGYYWITMKNQQPLMNRQLTRQIPPGKSTMPVTVETERTGTSSNAHLESPVPDKSNPVALSKRIPKTSSKTQEAEQSPSIAENIADKATNYENSVSGSAVSLPEEMQAMAYLSPIMGYAVAGSSEDTKNEDLENIRTMTPEEAAALLMADYNEGYTDEKVAARREWMLGSEIAPLYSDRNISSDKLQSSNIDVLNKNESGLIAYAGGFRVSYSKGKRLSVQSGIYYSRYGQQKNSVETVSLDNNDDNSRNFIEVNNSTGTISGVIDNKKSQSYNSAGNITEEDKGVSEALVYPLVTGTSKDVTLQQIFDYFEVPLIMKYKIIDRKIDFTFTGGMVTNFLVGNTVRMIYDGSETTIGETSDINRINYQGSVGLGLEYPVSKNFDFTVEPRFRYYLNPIGTSSDIIVHPFSFGFFAGLNYRF
ncbi:MAG TPA: outer membrane beta-barrel protein [Bacteroidales bacterium]|nr:outer membrane beta-barrel protein [Bacteroidales bacterium]